MFCRNKAVGFQTFHSEFSVNTKTLGCVHGQVSPSVARNTRRSQRSIKMRAQKRERRDRGWWNGERKSLDSDLWPHVFLFSFALLFAPYVSFLILLTDSLCPALIWPQAVISLTFPEVSWRPWRQRGQSAASVHLSVNIRSHFGQHQWCVQDPEATKMVQLVAIIKEQVLCFSLWDYTFVSYFWTRLIGFEIIFVLFCIVIWWLSSISFLTYSWKAWKSC